MGNKKLDLNPFRTNWRFSSVEQHKRLHNGTVSCKLAEGRRKRRPTTNEKEENERIASSQKSSLALGKNPVASVRNGKGGSSSACWQELILTRTQAETKTWNFKLEAGPQVSQVAGPVDVSTFPPSHATWYFHLQKITNFFFVNGLQKTCVGYYRSLSAAVREKSPGS